MTSTFSLSELLCKLVSAVTYYLTAAVLLCSVLCQKKFSCSFGNNKKLRLYVKGCIVPIRAEFCLFSNEHPSKKKKNSFFVYASFLDFVFLDKQALEGYVSFQGSNSSPSD